MVLTYHGQSFDYYITRPEPGYKLYQVSLYHGSECLLWGAADSIRSAHSLIRTTLRGVLGVLPPVGALNGR